MKIVEFISPNIVLDDWQSGKKSDVDVFEDQIQGWVFDQTSVLTSRAPEQSQHAGTALLGLVTPYFEMITCYLEGHETPSNQASEYLRRGLSTVLGTQAPSAAINKYVSQVRNGIAHELMFRTVILHRGGAGLPDFGIDPKSSALSVNPFWLVERTHEHFVGYVARLRSPGAADKDLVAKFNAFMKIRKARGI